MDTYLIVYPNYQDIQFAEDITELHYKYPGTVSIVIKLDEDLVKLLKIELPS